MDLHITLLPPMILITCGMYMTMETYITIMGIVSFGIRPVVSLKSEARATSIDLIGAWNIAI